MNKAIKNARKKYETALNKCENAKLNNLPKEQQKILANLAAQAKGNLKFVEEQVFKLNLYV
jgi:hypothetical protein